MRLRRSKVSAEALHDLIVQELEAAADDLLDDSRPEARRVHELRRRIKRLRALLRLLRIPLSGLQRSELNSGLRSIARKLSLVRETDVYPVSLARLLAGAPTQASRQLTSALRGYCRSLRAQSGDTSDLLADNGRALLALSRQIAPAQEWGKVNVKGLKAACMLGYLNACKALTRARKSGLAEDFHAWRRRVKDHHNQILLLARLLPAQGGAERRRKLESLAEFLGEANDLYELDAVLSVLEAKAAGAALPSTQMRLIAALAVTRHRALKLGQQLFVALNDDQRPVWLFK